MPAMLSPAPLAPLVAASPPPSLPFDVVFVHPQLKSKHSVAPSLNAVRSMLPAYTSEALSAFPSAERPFQSKKLDDTAWLRRAFHDIRNQFHNRRVGCSIESKQHAIHGTLR